MTNTKDSREHWIQNAENKKLIRHEDFIAGASKGLAILDCFANDRHRLNVTMAADKTGLTRAAARRHLLTLEYLGYLEFDGHYYYLTPKVLKFSGAYLSGAQLPKIAQPLLNLLTQQTSLIFSVMVLDGFEAITIARSAAHQQTDRVNPYGLHLGNRLPAHATSAGKILLSYLTEEAQHEWLEKYPLKALTKYTCTDNMGFLQLLHTVRADELYRAGKIELELVPQGNLACRIQAAGMGLGPIYTPTGFGTLLAEGKPTMNYEGKDYVLENPIKADFALIKASKGDRWGNLVYRKSARNFGPIMAMAADVTIAQVSEVVELGALDPEHIITPGIFVQHVVQVKPAQ